jgi:arylsulfatase
MLKRHEMWKEKYPNRPKARGVAFTGIENARPETLAIKTNLEALRKRLPFDPLEAATGFELPDKYKNLNTNAVD